MIIIKIGENVINNLFFTASYEVDKIYSLIKKLGITTFTYIKNFNDHPQNHFSNLTSWIEKQLGDCEFYSFSRSDHNRLLIDFYINNLSILKKFALSFKNIFDNTFKKAEQIKLFYNSQML